MRTLLEPAALRVGTELENGAVIVATQPAGTDWVVLAVRNAPYEPWITWRANEAGHTYWGHYFDDFGQALEDWRTR